MITPARRPVSGGHSGTHEAAGQGALRGVTAAVAPTLEDVRVTNQDTHVRKHGRTLAGALALAVAVGVAGTVLPGSAAATTGSARAAKDGGDRAGVREYLRRLTTHDGVPGALAEVRDRRGNTVLTSGVADVDSHAPVHRDSRFRIGSMTKMFTATTVLQLVEEGDVRLDAPVERYLPGVIRGHGNDGRKITVRQLLQHTSRLPDFLDYLRPQDIVADPLAHHDPRDLVALALQHPPVDKPDTDWD